MFIPKAFFDYLTFSKDEIVELRTENKLLSDQLKKAEIMSDWLRMRVNALEIERGLLFEKATNIKIPVPEMARVNPQVPQVIMDESFFEGIPFTPEGDKLAEKLGLN